LHALARNEDPRPVVPKRVAKSIGAEETFDTDLTTRDACERELVRLCDKVGARLRHAGCRARTVTLKIRFGDCAARTHAPTLAGAPDVSAVVLETARELLRAFDVKSGVRLLGVSCSQLDSQPLSAQGTLLFEEAVAARARVAEVERAVDEVRERFGSG